MTKAKKRKVAKRIKILKKKVFRKFLIKKSVKKRKVSAVRKIKKIKSKKTVRHRKKAVLKRRKKVVVKARKKLVKKIAKLKKRTAKKPIVKKTKKSPKIVKVKKKVVAKRKKIKPKPRKKVIIRKKIAKPKAKKIVKKPAVRQKKKAAAKKVVVKKSKQTRVKKQIIKTAQTEFPAESLFKAKIKVIGIGGGGGSIVSEIGRSLEKATFVIADTDVRALKKKSGIKYFWFGEEFTHGLGTGVNVDLAKRAAESAKEKISDIFKDQDIIIFVASLGGGLGSGATQVFADVAREFGGITLGIFTMPFKFEGANKQRIAQNALKALRQSLNVSLVIPNEKIFKVIGDETSITAAFSTVNKSLIESLESLIDLIYNPGVINIDFADLRTILKGRGNSAFLNTIEESGKDRVEKICEKVFKNPLLQNSGFEAEKILFNIEGSEKLSMFEVEKISSHISNLNPKAKIIFGISKNSKLNNKIKTTILMTGVPAGFKIEEGLKGTPPIKKIEPAKEVLPEKSKKPFKKTRKPTPPKKKQALKPKEQKPVSFIPVFQVPEPAGSPILEQKMDIVQIGPGAPSGSLNKKTIRRSGLEIKEAEALEEKKRIDQEKEWEIPAFLRKVKIKN